MQVMLRDKSHTMNIIGLLLGVIAAISVLATGCQPATPGQIEKARTAMGIKSDQPKIEVNKLSLGGNWFGECVRDVEKDEFYRQDKIAFSADFIDYSTEYFSDSSCTHKMFIQSLTGYFQLDGEKVSVNYANLSVLPEASIIAASFNQFDGFCALKDWEIGKIKTFSNLEICGFKSTLNAKIQRYGVNELYLDDRKLTLTK